MFSNMCVYCLVQYKVMHCFSVEVNSYTYHFLEATSYEIMVAVPSVLQMKLTFMKLVLRKVHLQ